MSSLGLTAYVLIWPAAAAVVMGVLTAGVVRDIRDARSNGKELV
ncbi:MAG: putative transporter small subunit [Spongiibacteraceae bacterium]|jgi:hypothetical protein|nr:putative transporter small subunit [Spongiibacteraceae bacterium]